MASQRIVWALVLACLAVVVGLGSCAMGAEAAGGGVGAFALASLGVELCLALLALAGGLLSSRSLRARLGLYPSHLTNPSLLLLVVGTLGVSHGLDGLLELSGLREHSALAEFDTILTGARGWPLWLSLLGVGLAPGIAEELLCRGLVQKGIEPSLGRGPAVVGGALVFGILHVDPIHGAFAALLGLYLGALVVLSGSVRIAILCHAVNNLVAVAAAAHFPAAQVPGPGSTLLGFAVAAGCLWAVWRRAGPLAARIPPSDPPPPSRESGSPPTKPPPELQQQAGSDDP
jgi:membrane protease YdiL (CAAX protease family)